MTETRSQRRLAENEVIFRQRNEKIVNSFNELERIAKEDKQEHLLKHQADKLYFYCECSDENCEQRVQASKQTYAEIHKNRDKFIIICGHETKEVEHVVEQNDNYCVVEKFNTPPESVDKLHQTNANNV